MPTAAAVLQASDDDHVWTCGEEVGVDVAAEGENKMSRCSDGGAKEDTTVARF
jgi:hypothetical protein